MNYATRTSLVKMLWVWLTLIVGFSGAGTASFFAMQNGEFSTIWWVVFAVVSIVFSLIFLRLVITNNYDCPKCSEGTTKFIYDESDAEILTCTNCKYSERSGFARGG